MYNYKPHYTEPVFCPICLFKLYNAGDLIYPTITCKCKANIEMSVRGIISKVKIQISDKLIILYLSSCNTIQIWKFKDNDFYLHKRINYTSQSQFSQLIQSYQIFS